MCNSHIINPIYLEHFICNGWWEKVIGELFLGKERRQLNKVWRKEDVKRIFIDYEKRIE
jgi:hypothetical protein